MSDTCRRNPHAGTRICDECPWRRDVDTGRFPPERYIALRDTSKQGFGPMFPCHKTADGADHACVGWLLVAGLNNFRVRLAAASGALDLDRLVASGPLFSNYAEMAMANGVSPRLLRDADLWTEGWSS